MLNQVFFLKILQVSSFSAVLYNISPLLFVFLIVYAFCGTVLTTCIFGRPLVQITYDILAKEANL